MRSRAYYNEFDSRAAAWLRELIKDGLIADGDVDERSIADVQPRDLDGYTQCHFFAGIGGWSYALRLAGWSDDRPVWTGSCPCQPFSVAGKGKGTADDRHLWPEFARLITECRPPVVIGEQVASKAGRDWLALVFADLEKLAYRRAGADLCAAGVGTPHIRQRLWWVADAGCEQHKRWGKSGVVSGAAKGAQGEAQEWEWSGTAARNRGSDGWLADTPLGEERWRVRGQRESNSPLVQSAPEQRPERTSASVRLAQSEHTLRGSLSLDRQIERIGSDGERAEANGITRACREICRPEAPHRLWSTPDWLYCRDRKWRPVESGTFPLAHGLPRGVVPSGDPGDAGYAQATSEVRVPRLKGYGNAIVPQVAAIFIGTYMDTCNA